MIDSAGLASLLLSVKLNPSTKRDQTYPIITFSAFVSSIHALLFFASHNFSSTTGTREGIFSLCSARIPSHIWISLSALPILDRPMVSLAPMAMEGKNVLPSRRSVSCSSTVSNTGDGSSAKVTLFFERVRGVEGRVGVFGVDVDVDVELDSPTSLAKNLCFLAEVGIRGVEGPAVILAFASVAALFVNFCLFAEVGVLGLLFLLMRLAIDLRGELGVSTSVGLPGP